MATELPGLPPMIYPYQCESEGCGREFHITASMAQRPGAHPPCPFCHASHTYRIYGGGGFIVGGEKSLDKLLDPKKPGRSTWDQKGIGTMAQQRQAINQVIDGKRKNAARVRAARRGTKRKDGEMRHVGAMSVEMFRCAQRTLGRHFYKEMGPKQMLKKFGHYFPE